MFWGLGLGGWHPLLFGPPPLMANSSWVTSWSGWALKRNHKSLSSCHASPTDSWERKQSSAVREQQPVLAGAEGLFWREVRDIECKTKARNGWRRGWSVLSKCHHGYRVTAECQLDSNQHWDILRASWKDCEGSMVFLTRTFSFHVPLLLWVCSLCWAILWVHLNPLVSWDPYYWIETAPLSPTLVMFPLQEKHSCPDMWPPYNGLCFSLLLAGSTRLRPTPPLGSRMAPFQRQETSWKSWSSRPRSDCPVFGGQWVLSGQDWPWRIRDLEN